MSRGPRASGSSSNGLSTADHGAVQPDLVNHLMFVPCHRQIGGKPNSLFLDITWPATMATNGKLCGAVISIPSETSRSPRSSLLESLEKISSLPEKGLDFPERNGIHQQQQQQQQQPQESRGMVGSESPNHQILLAS